MPFFFPAPYHPNVYTLSLHDALPISVLEYWILQLELEFEQDLSPVRLLRVGEDPTLVVLGLDDEHSEPRNEDVRSEEHTSELQSLTNLVCRLLLEKKKTAPSLDLTWR